MQPATMKHGTEIRFALDCFSPAMAAPGSRPHLHSPRETLGYKHVPQRLALEVRSPFDIYDTTTLCKGVKANAPRTSNIKARFFFTQPRTRPLALAFAGLVKSFSSCNIPKHFFSQAEHLWQQACSDRLHRPWSWVQLQPMQSFISNT